MHFQGYNEIDYRFHLFLILRGLDEAHSHWEEQFALLSLWIQFLFLSRRNLTDLTKITFKLVSSYPMI